MPRKLRAGRVLKEGRKLKEHKQTTPKVKYLPKPFTRIVKVNLKDFFS